jgi:hypothetical protein
MKAHISISGQINGNFKLARYISCRDRQNSRFNGFLLFYPSLSEARRGLNSAIKLMKRDDHDISYTRDLSISYDASRAVIYKGW